MLFDAFMMHDVVNISTARYDGNIINQTMNRTLFTGYLIDSLNAKVITKVVSIKYINKIETLKYNHLLFQLKEILNNPLNFMMLQKMSFKILNIERSYFSIVPNGNIFKRIDSICFDFIDR